MPRTSFIARTAWEDQFRRPTADSLLGGLDQQHLQAGRYAREALLTCQCGVEIVAWHGVPWRWTLVYRAAAGERAWAYLVPRPNRPLLVLPLQEDALRQLPPRIPRFIRDGLAAAPHSGALFWPEWELSSPSQIDELVRLSHAASARSLAPVA
jgi:hypothetical protein